MDSVTHIVLGACVGEVILGHKIGKKALLLGALAQSIPDIDFISAFWLTPAEQLLAHRGFTHSFVFVCLASPFMSLFFRRLLQYKVAFKQLTLFFILQMLIHILLDAFNNYGVGWFEPFSKIRISFNTIYVADVLMTIVPSVAFVILLVQSSSRKQRKMWAKLSIGWVMAYICVCIFNKMMVMHQLNRFLASENISRVGYFTTPAPLQSLLWMVVADDAKGYYVGYRSLLDSKEKIDFHYFPKNDHLLDSVEDHKEINLLRRFSRGFYTVEQWNDTLVFNDLRFGQIFGWQDPKEKFVFHYFLRHPEENHLVIQRGRFTKWNRRTFIYYLKRIMGN